MNIEELKQSMALELMRQSGWDPDHPEEHPLEWDLSRPDSQYSMCVEQASHMTDFLLTQLMQIPDPEAEEEFHNGRLKEFEKRREDSFLDAPYSEEELEEDSFLDEYGHIRRTKTNTISASLFIFMDAGTGNPRYVSDVRQWLAAVDKAGIPDDTEIDGQLYLDYDLEGPIETIECGECGQKDIIISNHEH